MSSDFLQCKYGKNEVGRYEIIDHDRCASEHTACRKRRTYMRSFHTHSRVKTLVITTDKQSTLLYIRALLPASLHVDTHFDAAGEEIPCGPYGESRRPGLMCDSPALHERFRNYAAC